MKKIFWGNSIAVIAFFGLFILGSAPSGFTQTTSLKLGSLDLDKIQEKWDKWQVAQKEITNLISSKRKELYEKNQELMQSYESFRLQKELLPADSAKERMDKLELERKKLRDKDTEDAKAVEDKKNALINPLMEELKKVIESVAKEGNSSFIFARRILFYVDEGFDITDKVLERLNKK